MSLSLPRPGIFLRVSFCIYNSLPELPAQVRTLSTESVVTLKGTPLCSTAIQLSTVAVLPSAVSICLVGLSGSNCQNCRSL